MSLEALKVVDQAFVRVKKKTPFSRQRALCTHRYRSGQPALMRSRKQMWLRCKVPS